MLRFFNKFEAATDPKLLHILLLNALPFDRSGTFRRLRILPHFLQCYAKLIASTQKIEVEIQQVREAIWLLYQQVKEASLSQQGKEQVLEAYDALLDFYAH